MRRWRRKRRRRDESRIECSGRNITRWRPSYRRLRTSYRRLGVLLRRSLNMCVVRSLFAVFRLHVSRCMLCNVPASWSAPSLLHPICYIYMYMSHPLRPCSPSSFFFPLVCAHPPRRPGPDQLPARGHRRERSVCEDAGVRPSLVGEVGDDLRLSRRGGTASVCRRPRGAEGGGIPAAAD